MLRSIVRAVDPHGLRLSVIAMTCASIFAPITASASSPGFLAALQLEALRAATSTGSDRSELWLAGKLNGIVQDDEVQAWVLGGDGGAGAEPGRSDLAISRKSWVALRLRTPRSLPLDIDGEAFFRLDRESGLIWHIDSASQTLLIDAPPAAFAGQHLSTDDAARATVTPAGSGGWGNY